MPLKNRLWCVDWFKVKTITVVSPSGPFVERLALVLLGESEVTVSSWWDEMVAAQPDYAIEMIAETTPDVVVLGPDVDRAVVLALAGSLHDAMPEVSVIEIADPDPSLFPTAMSAGIKDIVAEDAPFEVLREKLDRALTVSTRLAARRDPLPGSTAASIVVVVAPKGGTGKTSTIANLAVVLSQQFPGEVVLVDLDLQFGGVSELLMLEPTYTIADAARLPGGVDLTKLKGLLTRRDDLFVLAAPASPEHADAIEPELVEHVVASLATGFRWVLIDTSAGISPSAISVVEQATDSILLLSMDVLSISSMRKTIWILDQLGFTRSERMVVLNRANSKVGIDSAQVEKTLGHKVEVEIPSSRQVPVSLNKGEPFVEAQPSSTLSRRIADIALLLVDRQAARNSMLAGRGTNSRT